MKSAGVVFDISCAVDTECDDCIDGLFPWKRTAETLFGITSSAVELFQANSLRQMPENSGNPTQVSGFRVS